MSASPGRLPARPSARVWDPPGRPSPATRSQDAPLSTLRSALAGAPPPPSVPHPGSGATFPLRTLRSGARGECALRARRKSGRRPAGAQVGGERGSRGSARPGRGGKTRGPEPKSPPALRGKERCRSCPSPCYWQPLRPGAKLRGAGVVLGGAGGPGGEGEVQPAAPR